MVALDSNSLRISLSICLTSVLIDFFKCPEFSYVGFFGEFDLLDFDIFRSVKAKNDVELQFLQFLLRI